MIKAGVIGDPISHSLSPKLHNFLLDKYSIDGSYEKIEVKAENLEKDLNHLLFDENFAGLNVTIPHKESVFRLFQEKGYKINNSALITNSINTIYKENNEIIGDSSDGFGFIKNLDFFCDYNFIKKPNKSVIILGAGGAAKSIIPSLHKIGFNNFYIKNRNKTRSEQLKTLFKTQPFKIEIIDEIQDCELKNIDLLVNTTSLGMTNQPQLDLDITNLEKSTIICDIVYNPLITELLQNAKNQEKQAITGIGMLIFQAFLGFEKWFKTSPELTKQEFHDLSNILIKK